MPKIRGIKFKRVFECQISGFDFRQPDVTRENGFIVGRRFATKDLTHGDHMAATKFSDKSEKTKPDAPRKGIVHK